jgi:uncharacterized protein
MMSRPTLVVSFCLLLVSGCLRAGAPTAYYTLAAAAVEPPQVTAAGSDVVIGVGPVILPDYLERLPIVTRKSPNRLKIDDGQRWADPLQEEIARILRQNLAALTGARQVVAYPWHRDMTPDVQVRLNVFAFEGDRHKVHLNAQWGMTAASVQKDADVRSTRIEVPIEGAGTEALVAAMSRALDILSRQIAAGIMEKGNSKQ